MRRVALVLLGLLAVPASASAITEPANPFNYNALGPMRDVTAHWQRYHPAAVFCVKPQTDEYTPGGSDPR